MSQALQKDLTSHPVTHALNSLDRKSSKKKMLTALRGVLALALEEDPHELHPAAVYEFGWPALTVDKISALKAAALKTKSRSTVSGYLWAVKAIMMACEELGMITADEGRLIERAKGLKIRIPRQSQNRAGRRLTDGEIQALSQACANDITAAGIRDEAILALGITQGPRVSEVSEFKLEHYDPETGDLEIADGKGGKSRTIRASNSAKDVLDAWLQARGDEPGCLFTPINKSGVVNPSGKFSPIALGKMLKKRTAEAGVAPFTYHDLRRTMITNGWAMGIPGVHLQRVAGHSDISTTAKYDRGSLEEALKSGERLHWPSYR